jgi:hypothetical protein
MANPDGTRIQIIGLRSSTNGCIGGSGDSTLFIMARCEVNSSVDGVDTF